MAYYDVGASYSKRFGVCNYLLKCILAISGTKDYTYTATKEVRLIITISSRGVTTASVKKNNVDVQELVATTTEGSGGESHCFSVDVESGDVVNVSFVNGSGTYNIGYLNVLEIEMTVT